ncbi:hypothetical protein NLB96_02455 [Candidatus Aminicenantes bacterium AC-335-K20]|jgi:hypothetical protein|nr:hypothetical protein [SCandidatus Aminicenantes bacterium Aminicenantia_JdfR_composite]MCP2597645.1 hypothetical protein [Candidatus Aminicenantes bacterium AC-335-G13]MCP2598080.1 hypothetical protein [Candidatus Aminicenantes bacterium AC-335-L06]MCP2618004.1 hypothetical protein [Candidatus Aminicenantes bacterium AC-335-A11]MCP2619615.1 hypothetical protein [Candidatus Aminicenantes bacterium AC-335-K20]MCP2620692.1 hypothetical protein [Candidatus Aminicenantes bacterium AC-334-E05]
MEWVPYIIVFGLGAIVGIAEIIATFSQNPREAFRTSWAWILVSVNALTATGVFAIIRFYAKNFNTFLLAVGIGIGFPMLIRTKFTIAKKFMGGEDLSINIGWVYDQFLGWFKSEIDIAIVNKRLKMVSKLISKIPDIQKLKIIAHTILQERTILSYEEIKKYEKYINDIVNSLEIPEKAKQVALAKFILNMGGKEYVKSLI